MLVVMCGALVNVLFQFVDTATTSAAIAVSWMVPLHSKIALQHFKIQGQDLSNKSDILN